MGNCGFLLILNDSCTQYLFYSILRKVYNMTKFSVLPSVNSEGFSEKKLKVYDSALFKVGRKVLGLGVLVKPVCYRSHL